MAKGLESEPESKPHYPELPPIQNEPTAAPTETKFPINIPSTLESLVPLDQLFLKQNVEINEVFRSCSTKNRYIIKDLSGAELFTAKEETNFLTRICCGEMFSLNLVLKDSAGVEVLNLKRPMSCNTCLLPCILPSIQIMSGGVLLGTVEKEWNFLFQPKFRVKNGDGTTVLQIQGPFCPLACCSDVNFDIKSVSTGDSSVSVGKITKKWKGCFETEACTDADLYGISFPLDLDAKMKAVLLGACFLIFNPY